MESKLLDGLNAAQREAVEFKDGPLLVLAGPGSGKTRVVTHRIARLLESGVWGRNIAALTFTNKAAEEMKNRLEVLSPGNRVWIGTFHRFCSWILRIYIDYVGLEPNWTIYDTDESRQLIDGLVDKRELPSGCDSGKILSAISWAKNGLVLPEDYCAREGHLLGKMVEKVYPEYQKALRRANAVDFDDLLIHVALLLKNNEEIRGQLDDRFRYVLVDEYQDTNLVQYAIARALSIDYPNLAVTGDPDQSIYGWRGANIRNILEFEKDFDNVKVIRLEENYRSCGNILAVASALIKHNKQRKDKELFTQNQDGKKPRVLRCFNHQEEADFIADEIASEIDAGVHSPKDYAIFFRMNALSRNLEHSLRRRGVPFQLVRGLEFFNRKEIKDVLAYLQLIYNPSDTVSFLRVVNLPVRGIGKVTVARLRENAQRRGISMLEAAKNVREISGVSAKTVKSIERFAAMIEKLADLAATSDLEILLSVLLEETQYLAGLARSETEEDKQRLANVQELLSEMREFDRRFDEEQSEAALRPATLLEDDFYASDRLGRFLEQAALVSDVDAYDESDRVSLMTLHAAKGLEFPVVYLIALEDNIIPHERSSYDKAQLEEERRLLFVGITRAKEEVRMSRTEFREYRGTYSSSILSRFLFELPNDRIEICDAREKGAEFRSNGESPSADGQRSGDGESFLSDYLDQISDESEDDEAVTFDSDGSAPKKVRGKKRGKREKRLLRKDDDEGITVETDEYCDVPPEADSEMIFDEDGDLIPASDRKRSMSAGKPGGVRISTLRTAADLASETKRSAAKKPADPSTVPDKSTAAPSNDPPAVGTLLRHPDYGVGIIKGIFGPPSGRIVHVEFLSGVGTVDIPLADPNVKIIMGKSR